MEPTKPEEAKSRQRRQQEQKQKPSGGNMFGVSWNSKASVVSIKEEKVDPSQVT